MNKCLIMQSVLLSLIVAYDVILVFCLLKLWKLWSKSYNYIFTLAWWWRRLNLQSCLLNSYFYQLSRGTLQCRLCPVSEILEQTSSTSSFGTLSFCLQKTVGPSLVRNFPSSTCVTSVPTHWQFPQYCNLRLFMLSLNTQSPSRFCGYFWPSWPFVQLIYK